MAPSSAGKHQSVTPRYDFSPESRVQSLPFRPLAQRYSRRDPTFRRRQRSSKYAGPPPRNFHSSCFVPPSTQDTRLRASKHFFSIAKVFLVSADYSNSSKMQCQRLGLFPIFLFLPSFIMPPQQTPFSCCRQIPLSVSCARKNPHENKLDNVRVEEQELRALVPLRSRVRLHTTSPRIHIVLGQ